MKHLPPLFRSANLALLFAALLLGTLTQSVLEQLHWVDSIGTLYFVTCALLLSVVWGVVLACGLWLVRTMSGKE